jgi:hypothetical protein
MSLYTSFTQFAECTGTDCELHGITKKNFFLNWKARPTPSLRYVQDRDRSAIGYPGRGKQTEDKTGGKVTLDDRTVSFLSASTICTG